MSVGGSLRTMPIEDVLEWIDRRAVRGSLTVDRGSVKRGFTFDAGSVTNVSSNVPEEHLGQLLLERGLVDQESLNEAVQVRANTRVLIGKILTMVGAVDEDGLRRTLEEKMREAICDVIAWREGTFEFEPEQLVGAASEYEVSVPLGECIAEGKRRAARWEAIGAVIPSDATLLRVEEADPADPEEGDAALLSAVRRGLTVGEVVAERREGRFPVFDRLAALVEAGVLAVERAALESALPAPELEKRAVEKAKEGDRAAAFELICLAVERDPENDTLRTRHRDLERSLFAELSRELLTRFCVPKLLTPREELDALELTDGERALARRIDGHWDLLSLLRVSPLREVEALITFKRLADRGIISL
jgi:hypothetical protein